MDEIVFFAGSILFLLAVIIFWVGWSAKEKAAKQRNILNRWEGDLRDWASAQQENIQHMQQETAKNSALATQAQVELEATKDVLQQTQQELETVAEEANTHAIALRGFNTELTRVQQELDDVTQERDKIKADFAKFVDFLVEAGVLTKNLDALPTSPAELQEFYLQTKGDLHLPEVPGLMPQLLRVALLHAANRAFSDHVNASKPFSRAYMVTQGPLSRDQFERLLSTLADEAYVSAVGSSRTTFQLTDKGWRLLQALKEDKI